MSAAPTPERGSAPRGRWPEILERSLDCVHCGLCLSSCPTYRETGRENSSPRGRIYLARGVAEGRLELGETLAEEAHLCLGCRACETACPSGVRFGSLIELTRAEVADAHLRDDAAGRLERFALRHVVAHRGRLRLAVDALAATRALRLDRVVLPFLPSRLRQAWRLLPAIPSRTVRRPRFGVTPARGERRGRVGLLLGCIASEFFADVNEATLRVLAHNGFDVVVPSAQGCCGALQAHSGDDRTARELAANNARVFREAGVERLVVNSAGCGAALRDAADWLPGEGDALADSVCDVAEFLDAEGLRPPQGRIDATLCYDDPCHLVHGQKVESAPRRVLAAIPGIRLVPHADPTGCCGAAGTYNLTHPEMSAAVLSRKLDSLAAADPDVIATGNPGCLMQLRAGAAARGLRARVVHPITLLADSYLT